MLVGEAPGRAEDERGRPFCGPSGLELDRYLERAAQIHRRDVYVTNLCKVRPSDTNDDPTADQIAQYEPDLYEELGAIQPRVVVAIGRISAAWFLGIPQDAFDLEKSHGIPYTNSPRTPAVVIPVTHPAAGLHQPERYQTQCYRDWEAVGKVLRGEYSWSLDTEPCHYGDTGGYPSQIPFAAVDTEGSRTLPWGLSFATHHRMGAVVRVGKPLPIFNRVVMHNSLYDLPVLRAMGIDVDPDHVEDSMIAAYVLSYPAKGLKTLAYRLCGMEMEDYSDIIKDADEALAKEYLTRVAAAYCPTCKGEGEVGEPHKRQSKRTRDGLDPVKYKRVRCPDCQGDCTRWPLPTPQLVFGDDFCGRLYKPRSCGRSVRQALVRGTDLRATWSALDESIRAAPERELGPLRPVTLDDVQPPERAIRYSARDADATIRVWDKLRAELDADNLWDIYHVDMGIVPIIDRMQTNGILIDKDHLAKLKIELEHKNLSLVDSIYNLTNQFINPLSHLQVAKLLGVDDTNEKTLEAFKIRTKDDNLRTLVDLILDYREGAKMVGTYCQPLQAWADRDSRIHTTFVLTGTLSGRLASKNPNLQNIPARSELGKRIRGAFIARPGCTLVSVDLDQIELRVGAHLAADQNMLDIFRSGKDIHAATASLVYRKPLEEVTQDERRASKTVNFGVFYGMSARRLQNELALMGIVYSTAECDEIIASWFRAYPGIRNYMARCHSEARTRGYVSSLLGRRRYLPGVHSKIPQIREESLRWSVNHPDQATAAEILKLWMRRVWEIVLPDLQRHGHCEPLLTVHDELIFEVEAGMEELVIAMVAAAAQDTMKLLVPIAAKGKCGQTWASME